MRVSSLCILFLIFCSCNSCNSSGTLRNDTFTDKPQQYLDDYNTDVVTDTSIADDDYTFPDNDIKPENDVTGLDDVVLDDNTPPDDDSNCLNHVELREGAGNEVCPYQKSDDRTKRLLTMIVTADEKGQSVIVERIVFQDDRSETLLLGTCDGKECGLSLRFYDKNLVKDSIVGKELVFYAKEGFYGSENGEYEFRDVYVVRHKDGTLIAVKGIGIVNESSGENSDARVWPSALVPELQVNQKLDLQCESFCVETPIRREDFSSTDVFIAPPLEIKFSDKSAVVVRNGEVIRLEGYEYFVRESIKAAPEDPDGFVYDLGKKYRFDFFILNTEALK